MLCACLLLNVMDFLLRVVSCYVYLCGVCSVCCVVCSACVKGRGCRGLCVVLCCLVCCVCCRVFNGVLILRGVCWSRVASCWVLFLLCVMCVLLCACLLCVCFMLIVMNVHVVRVWWCVVSYVLCGVRCALSVPMFSCGFRFTRNKSELLTVSLTSPFLEGPSNYGKLGKRYSHTSFTENCQRKFISWSKWISEVVWSYLFDWRSGFSFFLLLQMRAIEKSFAKWPGKNNFMTKECE